MELNSTSKALFSLGCGLAFIALCAFVFNGVSYVAPPNKPAVSGVVCPRDSKSYQETKEKKNVVLLNNASSYGRAGADFIKQYEVTIVRSGLNSNIACGYLFYSMSIGGKPIQEYENLYMTPSTGKQFGGHIYPNGENLISENETATSTEMLFPLNDVSYDGNERKNLKKADWSSLLNVTGQMDFTIALNTLNKSGEINSVEIAYKCWNPQTGKETDDCNLEVTNVTPI